MSDISGPPGRGFESHSHHCFFMLTSARRSSQQKTVGSNLDNFRTYQLGKFKGLHLLFSSFTTSFAILPPGNHNLPQHHPTPSAPSYLAKLNIYERQFS